MFRTPGPAVIAVPSRAIASRPPTSTTTARRLVDAPL
jgi:hypothetical protein